MVPAFFRFFFTLWVWGLFLLVLTPLWESTIDNGASLFFAFFTLLLLVLTPPWGSTIDNGASLFSLFFTLLLLVLTPPWESTINDGASFFRFFHFVGLGPFLAGCHSSMGVYC
ncbi:uncharacterized protein BJ212DRAFT_137535 [Suillus subaureus]|uniref:Uncharacterized protein n=1 Tax=Suillus subaureus TaxID=48587 RepID=A0A9P7JDZ8_9AGAM|nr:uncharacterized protein BJ212DRAFT_137535 [Suillus subaureus]KAG1817594.1 hypothetical protein BJ212DRAFT_137535 [Suillus subaureus]